MEYLQSIAPIPKAYRTQGSRPVEVLCNDFNSYICKYSLAPADRLCREYLAYRFAKIWGLRVPEAAFVQIDSSHIDLGKIPEQISFDYFSIPCFGSQKLEYSKEIDQSFSEKKTHEIRFLVKEDFLKIALFDLWLGNEDRNHNNYNLLLHGEEGKETYSFAPIDHEKIFNSGTLNHPIVPLTEEESLIFTPIFSKLFKSSQTIQGSLNLLLDSFWGWHLSCIDQVEGILGEIPETWGIDTAYLADYLKGNPLSNSWAESILHTFLSFIQRKISS